MRLRQNSKANTHPPHYISSTAQWPNFQVENGISKLNVLVRNKTDLIKSVWWKPSQPRIKTTNQTNHVMDTWCWQETNNWQHKHVIAMQVAVHLNHVDDLLQGLATRLAQSNRLKGVDVLHHVASSQIVKREQLRSHVKRIRINSVN